MLSAPLHREVVECDMILVGLVVMQNRLKPQTTPVMATLGRAGIRTVMITGEPSLYICGESASNCTV